MNRRRLTAFVVLLAVTGLCTGVLADDAVSEKGRTVYIKNTEPRLVATMKHKGPFDDIPGVVAKLMAGVEKGDHLKAGPVMVIYYNSPQNVSASELLWEVAIPVARPAAVGGSEMDKMGFKVFEPMFVAYTYHIGPYEKVGDTFDKVFGWIEVNKYPLSGFPVEVYWSDPENTPADKLVTEVWLPILERETPGIKR
ncbi:MAG: GyrI-like domain-containing protein [Candidatus Eisenbacteria bacterium]